MRPNRRRATWIALVLVSMTLAGCLGPGGGGPSPDDGGPVLGFASFEEALNAPGPVLQPADGPPTTLRAKVLAPANPDAVNIGALQVAVLLFESEEDAPVEDASVTLDAFMDATGEEAAGKQDPIHRGLGIYVGAANLTTAGDWRVVVNVTLEGETFSFMVPLSVSDPDVAPLRYTSFMAAFEAPGRTVPPVEDPLFVQEESDSDIQSTEYNETYGFPVVSRHAEKIRVEFRYDAGTVGAGDDLTFALESPDGETLDSENVGGTTVEDNLEVRDPTPGNHTVRVSGQAFGASYNVTIRVTYTLSMTVLDPPDPTQARSGRRPLVVLLFDEDGPVPETNATMTLTSRHPATGEVAEDEEAPNSTDHGTYTGWTNHDRPGTWRVNVTAALPTGHTYLYSVEFEVQEP